MNSQMRDLIVGHEGYSDALARQIARRLPPGIDIEELRAAARLGLVQAAARFRFDQGTSFETFAYRRIRGAVFDALRGMAGLPARIRTWIAAEEGVDLVADGIPPETATDPLLAQAALPEAIRSVAAVFLVAGVHDDTGPEPVFETTPLEELAHRELADRVRAALAGLSRDEQLVLRRHYYEGASFTDIARELAVNKSTISRRHALALVNLRRQLGENVALSLAG